MNVLKFAHEVLAMQERIEDLEYENARLRRFEKDYNDLLNSSLQHNQEMSLNMLKVIMTPGVVEAMKENT